MSDPSEPKSDPTRCALCQSTDQLESRHVSCGRTTTWKVLDGDSESEHTRQDDIRVWPLSLCRECITPMYERHVDKGVSEAMSMFGIVVAVAILGVLALLATDRGWIGPSDGAMRGVESLMLALIVTALGFGALISILMLPGAAWNLVKALRERAAAAASSSMTSAAVETAFVEAGATLVKKKRDLPPPPLSPDVSGTELSFGALWVEEIHPDALESEKKGKKTKTYGRSKTVVEALQAAHHPDEAVPPGWAHRYRELGRVDDHERLARSCDKAQRTQGKWFLYGAVVGAAVLFTSGRAWLAGNDTAGFLLLMPVGFVIGGGMVLAWIVEGSDVLAVRRLFEGFWQPSCLRRFALRTAVGLLLVGIGGAYVVSSRAAFYSQNPNEVYERSGIRFAFPREWTELSEEKERAFQKAHPGEIIALFNLDESAIIGLTLESSRMSPDALFDFRRKQVREALASSEVTAVHRLERIDHEGLPGIILDMNRRDGSRGRLLQVFTSRGWYGLSLVASDGDLEDHEEHWERALESIDFPPKSR